ncbi:MAG: penicillin-binding protein activator [Xanthomonadales bacterium]|nr:penicillin-binding protein activator [Xanthomonadales bacterium]
MQTAKHSDHRTSPRRPTERAATRGLWLPLAGLAAAAILSACTATGPTPVPEAAPPASAAAAFANGSFEQAARMWQRDALDAAPAEAAALRVRAAEAWLLADDEARAQALLEWIDPEELDAPGRGHMHMVMAELALRRGRPSEARALLLRARRELPAAERPRYEALNRRIEQALEQPVTKSLEAVASQIARMPHYQPDTTIALLAALESVPSGELALRAANPRAERQLAGWLDLALVIRRNLVVADELQADVGRWKSRHPDHLLTENQALDTWLRYRQTFSRPLRVAVLVPGSGSLEAAGAALRDGLLSAYLEDPGGAELLFFPTEDTPQSAIASYFNAREAGADFIIGPLRKESVAAMLELAGMTTPVLALNDFPEQFTPPPELARHVLGISLSQEEEVRAIANRLEAMGYRRAAVLAPENLWGDRMAGTMEAEFLQGNGQIVAAARYPEEQNDHSAILRRLLKIDESEARKKQLQNTLQMPLDFEPIRRQDIDVIFMAADPVQARQLRPQLRFHDAGDIPVYATGRIYSGRPDPARNLDLDGLRFPATRWQLEHALMSEIPPLASLREGRLGSLYALGQDAWNLLPWLQLMQKDRDFEFPGQSGAYRASRGVNLAREPAWAQFRRGLPVALKEPVRRPGAGRD